MIDPLQNKLKRSPAGALAINKDSDEHKKTVSPHIKYEKTPVSVYPSTSRGSVR
jgi:hypothetical protein